MPSLAISSSGTNVRPEMPTSACAPVGAGFCRSGAAISSPPPCGEGLGVGVVEWGTALPQPPDPPPQPSPTRGEGDAVAPLNVIERECVSTSMTNSRCQTQGDCMRLIGAAAFLVLSGTMQAPAAELPTRKAGLWE